MMLNDVWKRPSHDYNNVYEKSSTTEMKKRKFSLSFVNVLKNTPHDIIQET